MEGSAMTSSYATTLRKELTNIFAGDMDALEGLGSDAAALDISHLLSAEGEDELSLEGVEEDLEALQNHDIIRGILEQGRVLQEYTSDVDSKLRQVEMESIQDYIAESENMLALHEQIKGCDSVLAGMEQLLGRFQSDLGKVSEEIRQLQVQSQTMNIKLKNRRQTEAKLGNFIDHLTVSESMVTSILESDVNADYLEYLLELDARLKFVHEDELARMSHATKDLEPALEKLRVRALAKVREFVLQMVYLLKKPRTNVQMVQQSKLVKQKDFVRFLKTHGQEVYREICTEYVSTVSRIYSSQFRTYLTAMQKLLIPGAAQGDVLGAAEATGPAVNVMALFKRDAAAKNSTEAVFELGDRAAVLAQLDAMPVVPLVAEAEGRRFLYEAVFRNVHKLLIDTALSEFAFCMEFFEEEGVFRELLGPIVAVVEADLSTAVQECWDMLTLLLMIRLSREQRRALGSTQMQAVEEYLDRVQMLLWPRLKVLYGQQLASVRQGTERALFNDSTAPHFAVKRYAALAASMLLLMVDDDTATPGVFKAQSFHDMMDRMWAAMCDLLLRMSNMFRDKRMGIIFLITNYNHIHMVLRRADSHGLQGAAGGAGGPGTTAPTSSQSAGIGQAGVAALKVAEDQVASCTHLYVEDQLGSHFPMLIEFVKKAEQQQKRLGVADGQPIPNYTPQQAGPILRDFATRWQRAIETMHQEVGQQFTDTDCGRDVLQASMTALLQYYTRLLELLKKQGPDGVTAVREAVNVPAIMYEIKRHAKT